MEEKVKDRIKLLNECGYSYREISKDVNYSVGQVWNIINKKKVFKFKKYKLKKRTHIPADQMSANRLLSVRIGAYKGRTNNSRVSRKTHSFTIWDVYNKFGDEPICYLTGEKIDLNNNKDYCLDHIQPKSRGGDNSLDNLGFLKRDVNYAKNSLTVNEFLELCVRVLEYNNYIITPPPPSPM